LSSATPIPACDRASPVPRHLVLGTSGDAGIDNTLFLQRRHDGFGDARTMTEEIVRAMA
jgi:NAD/NADP transhydrogenase beta subunit